MKLTLALASLLAVVGLAAGAAQSAPAPNPPVDFARSIQPLFAARCQGCHGPVTQQAGLRLDRRADAMKGGPSGPVIVPGHADESRLVTLISGKDPKRLMPPIGQRLTPAEVALVRRWIDEGATWPEQASAPHWSFRPIRRPALPRIKNAGWCRNPIDRFVLARLEREHLRPSPPADRVTLIRRVTLDLTGLPPTIAEVDRFLADRGPDAYEKVVDHLLASPHCGEQWAHRWLDLARYADTNGYEKDNPRSIWKYRDWVIDAFNRDLPFDEFTIEQIAGDMLPNATLDQKIATSFHRNTMINQEGGVDQEQFRWESVVDRVNTTGTVFLGLTVGCCQCHDHKYDPLKQREYWGMFALMNGADEPEIDVAAPEEIRKRDAVRAEIAATEAKLKPLGPKDPARAGLERKLAELKASEPQIPTTMVMQERAQPRETHRYERGDFLHPAEMVPPAIPAVLPPLPPSQKADRLALARWLVDRRNPLTPRVTVNRYWDAFFGRGIVKTLNDFGTRGDPPTHPELLDWLASEFVAPSSVKGSPTPAAWSMKALCRLIVTSAAYRQSSRVTPALLARDPENALLARGPRFRVDAETVRDVALAASGLLSPKIGGPSVFAPQPEGVTLLSYGALEWKTATGPDRYRRGLYTFLKRTAPYPALLVFDGTSREVCTARRQRSNTPLQALNTLNDEVFTEAAQAMARRVLTEGWGDLPRRIRFAFRLCVARGPDPEETRRLAQFWEQQRARFAAAPDKAAEVAGVDPKRPPEGINVADLAAWTMLSRAVLNLDETITKE